MHVYLSIVSVVILGLSSWSGCVYDRSGISVPGEDGVECNEVIALPVMGADITIKAATLNGESNVAIVGPGEMIEVALDYHIEDCGCRTCIDQIEVGFTDTQEFQYCAYSSVPGCNGDSGSDTGMLMAPMEPGTYYVGFGKRQDYSCGETGGMVWWNDAPPKERTFGAVCVVE